MAKYVNHVLVRITTLVPVDLSCESYGIADAVTECVEDNVVDSSDVNRAEIMEATQEGEWKLVKE